MMRVCSVTVVELTSVEGWGDGGRGCAGQVSHTPGGSQKRPRVPDGGCTLYVLPSDSVFTEEVLYRPNTA